MEPVIAGDQALTSIEYTYPNGEKKEIALGYCRSRPRTTSINGSEITWTERQLVVRSLAIAAKGEKSLRTRLAKAQEALFELGQPCRGKKRLTQLEEWQAAGAKICQRYRVQGLLMVEISVNTQERPIRRYGDRPARVIQSNSLQLSVTLDEAAVTNAIRMMGWRVYVTNQPPEELSVERAVVAYREEYLIERGFGRFKGFPLSLRPMYLQREDHIKGLMRLLSIGLRVLTLLEFQVRRRLASLDEKLAGLYAGNPQRATARPTAEKLLAAFKEITLLLIEGPQQTYVHLTPLSPLQQQILALLEFPLEIYTQLSSDAEEPP